MRHPLTRDQELSLSSETDDLYRRLDRLHDWMLSERMATPAPDVLHGNDSIEPQGLLTKVM